MTRTFPEGTLVYRHEDGHYPVYAVMSEKDGKYDLSLPWQPSEAALQGVRPEEVEPVFAGRAGRVPSSDDLAWQDLVGRQA